MIESCVSVNRKEVKFRRIMLKVSRMKKIIGIMIWKEIL